MRYLIACKNRLFTDKRQQLLLSGSAIETAGVNIASDAEKLPIQVNLTLLILSSVPERFEPLDLREHLATLSESDYQSIARAQHLLHWRTSNRFCGVCANELALDTTEFSLACQNCDNRQYPRISPCIIVLVEDGDRLLLAHNVRFPDNRFSTLAGFIEAGETAEQAVAREIKEEVGIEVSGIRYFKSQTWPFPDSLMLAFFADYAGGEIQPDGVEVSEGRWFRVEQLNEVSLPPEFAISRQLIDDWVRRQGESV